jgi:hypothetical protein
VTGAQFSEVDIDLLADYVGGALAGTPEEARVAALVAGDPAWRAAHAAVARGMTSVEAGLHALGAGPEPMPADLVVRLDAALAAASGVPAAAADTAPPDTAGARDTAPPDTAGARGTAPPDTAGARGTAAAPEAAVPGAVPGPRLVAVPGDRGGRAPGRGRAAAAAWRRGLRRSAPIAAAAAVLALAGVGVAQLRQSSGTSGRPTAARAPAAASDAAGGLAPGALAAPPPADRIVTSGADYRRDTLAGAAAATTMSGPALKSVPSPAAEAARAAGLARLTARSALQACLDAIAGENGGGPVTVQSVDYARYEGAPAVVVRFAAANGRWAWASGPDCGAPGAGAATRAAVKVG